MAILCSDQTLTVLLAVAGILLVSLAVAMAAVPRRRLASIEAVEGSDWRLGVVVEHRRKVRLCVRYRVGFHGEEDNFGLVVDYHCDAAGEMAFAERAGVGDKVPPKRDRRIATSYNCGFTSTPAGSSQRATIVLAVLGPFDETTELVAGGVLTTDGDSVLEQAEVFFS
jgi:hypothetical protein